MGRCGFEMWVSRWHTLPAIIVKPVYHYEYNSTTCVPAVQLTMPCVIHPHINREVESRGGYSCPYFLNYLIILWVLLNMRLCFFVAILHIFSPSIYLILGGNLNHFFAPLSFGLFRSWFIGRKDCCNCWVLVVLML